MFDAPKSDFLVPFDGSFRVAKSSTAPATDRTWHNKKKLKNSIRQMDSLQQALFAAGRHSLLLVIQGMDAAGKDSTVRAVMEGINPAGCQVFNFKKPSDKELDHDFLWRTTRALPERGRIGIFNRSHYEEVLVVRVHPGILKSQRLPDSVNYDSVWEERYESIRDFEKHIARNGTVILKFWLNVSKQVQKERFLSRLDVAEKQWKFNPRDVVERQHWDEYMQAYEDALNATSRPWAPWYAVPADSKPFTRARVANIIVAALESLGIKYPEPSKEDRAEFDECRAALTDTNGQ